MNKHPALCEDWTIGLFVASLTFAAKQFFVIEFKTSAQFQGLFLLPSYPFIAIPVFATSEVMRLDKIYIRALT